LWHLSCSQSSRCHDLDERFLIWLSDLQAGPVAEDFPGRVAVGCPELFRHGVVQDVLCGGLVVGADQVERCIAAGGDGWTEIPPSTTPGGATGWYLGTTA
jgi:hypothetical protein